jgi:hypothetical protein
MTGLQTLPHTLKNLITSFTNSIRLYQVKVLCCLPMYVWFEHDRIITKKMLYSSVKNNRNIKSTKDTYNVGQSNSNQWLPSNNRTSCLRAKYSCHAECENNSIRKLFLPNENIGSRPSTNRFCVNWFQIAASIFYKIITNLKSYEMREELNNRIQFGETVKL